VGQRHRHATWPHPVQAVRDTQVPEPTTRTRFEDAVSPHLHAADHVARWLTRHDQDAEDVVQEASMRAWTCFGSVREGRAAPGSSPACVGPVTPGCSTTVPRNR